MTTDEAIDKFVSGELEGDDSEEACEALRLVYGIPEDARMRYEAGLGWQVNVNDISTPLLGPSRAR